MQKPVTPTFRPAAAGCVDRNSTAAFTSAIASGSESLPHPRARRVDRPAAHAPVEVEREHGEALACQLLREVARVIGDSPDIVDHHDTGMHARARVDEMAEFDFAGFHRGPVYSSGMAFERELEVALAAAREAGEIIRRHYEVGTRAWEKSADNPVTLADLEADAAIVARLREAFPEDAILSEESVRDDGRLACQRTWIVDPMDGTKEFTRRIPEFAVSVALALDGVPVVGVVANPIAAVTVWATRGGGTFRDGRRVRVSSCAKLADAVLVASRSELARDEFAPYDGWFRELRPMGSIAWKLACIASGEGDLNLSVAPKNEWDVCAGDVLVREAGGRYLDFAGRERRYNQADPRIAAGMGAGPLGLLEQFNARERLRASY